MKQFAITFCAAAFLFACNNENKTAETKTDDTKIASSTTTTSDNQSEAWVPVDSATAVKAMMEAGTPGKEQAMLAKDNGTWKAETSMWMSPESQPMKSTGVMTNKMILDGHYQQGMFKGNMMGMPFEGTSTVGYDNARKIWVSSWVDNMSTTIMNMEGTWDDATKTATYTGKMYCPANGKMCDMKQTMKMVDDNHQVMEMYGPDMKTGKMFKNMEMKLTRN